MHVLRPRSTEPRGLVGCTGEQPPQGPLAFTAPLPVLGEQRGAAAVTCAACSPAVHARRPVLLTGTLGGLGPAVRGRGSVPSGLCTAVTRRGRLSRLSPVGGLLPPPHQGQRREVSAACGGRPSSLDGSRIQFRAAVGQGPLPSPQVSAPTATLTPRHLARSVLRARSRGSPASGPFRASRHLRSLPGLARRGLAHRRLSPFLEVPGATTGPRPGADDPRTVSGGSTPQGGDSAGPSLKGQCGQRGPRALELPSRPQERRGRPVHGVPAGCGWDGVRLGVQPEASSTARVPGPHVLPPTGVRGGVAPGGLPGPCLWASVVVTPGTPSGRGPGRPLSTPHPDAPTEGGLAPTS